ncbi:TIGR01906 family membrane protein [Candidatus Galacturonibacter soehngenii]|nr:TIGR01906 family membrane protein [Candidatus Galacturonibacter soehngenii]MBA4688110.1 TIGR01906 family membrane protein [Candidatus Galacturonibacter soehngenii]
MNKVRNSIAIIGSILFIVALFFTSFQIVLYGIPGFYEREYSKYNVLDDVKMEMEDVLYVTDEMMDYLIDKRSDLVIETKVDGQAREFFNEREKLHMEDVKRLFLQGLLLRNIAGILTILAIIGLVLLKTDLKKVLPKAFIIATIVVGILSTIFAFYVANHFAEVFVQFHLIFFDNDLWLLNPETDLMINILPEGFFFDTVKAIGATFGVLLGVLLVASGIIVKRNKDK